MLRRLILVCLILLLPIDSVWAAMDVHFRPNHPADASIRANTANAAAQAVDSFKLDRSAATSSTVDCSACHMATLALAGDLPAIGIPAGGAHAALPPSTALSSIYIDPLERPKWVPLAA